MGTTYEKYLALPFNKALICLGTGDISTPYFCYPINAVPIGFEGSILYCFLPEYEGTVFACNPESCTDRYVYPLAKTFDDFLGLILACGSANPVEQIIWMGKPQFEQHLQEEKQMQTAEQKEALSLLGKELHISAMELPFEYVKALQADFDYSKVQFSDEYYDILGIER